MRLLKIEADGELSFTKDLIDSTPSYAILSHTWGDDEDEVTFSDIKDGLCKSKAGYTKIQFCVEQARKDDLQYLWVDTCCIDKANHAELAEAINSMFCWYRNAAKCYVFLSDVSARKRDATGSAQAWMSVFRNSRWFTRGWTLQELLAPREVEFYSREGEQLGNKRTLEQDLHEITDIPIMALRGAPLSDFTSHERMRWASKRNTKRKEDKAYCLLGIFDASMPPIYGEGEERAFDRLNDEIGKSFRRQLDANGLSFLSSNSSGLEKYGAEAAPLDVGSFSQHGRRRALLSSLGFDQMDSRRSTIKRAYSTTCQWLLKHSAYLDWIDTTKIHEHTGLLWINGKPGAGKSTLMKFAHANAIHKKPEHETILSFFFNARGEELERSTLGMYRALIFQLLNKFVELQELLDDLHPSLEHQGQCPTWTIDSLCELLSAAATRLKQQRLKFFIDALDECAEQEVQEMIVFFEQLGQDALENGNQLYICFASRHYPTIDIRSGLQLTLEDERGHGEDLARYVQNHLRAGKGKYIEEIRSQIEEKANGVFMWAVLVVDILNEEFKRGRIFAVKKRLQEIPAKLSDLFKDVLRRDCTNMDDLLLCLQLVLFAKRPLRREEFYFAMVAGLDPEPGNLTEWKSEDITLDDMNRFVLNSSKGVAELTKSKTPTVQFIHESVRDFLIRDHGLRELWPEFGEDHSLAHDQLKRCCRNYLNVNISDHEPSDLALLKPSSERAKEVRQTLTIKFPFLEYASRHVLYHADEAAVGISQDDFLRDFPLGTWVRVTNLFERFDIRRYTPKASLLYVLAENNFARLIRTTCGHNPKIGIRGERYQYPLFAALANNHQAAVRALLYQDEDSSTGDVAAHLEYGRAFSFRKDQTPLSWALEKGHKELAETLVTCENCDLYTKFIKGRNNCFSVADKHYESIVKWLLMKDQVNIKSKENRPLITLLYDGQQRQSPFRELLSTNDTDIEIMNKYGGMALTTAALNGHAIIVKLLLAKDANIEATDVENRTALVIAAYIGHESIVQLLLAKGANMGALDVRGQTPLSLAAKYGHESIVPLLLAKGANVEAVDNQGRTALSWAASNGHEANVQLLLAKGANVEVVDDSGQTALILAAFRDHETIVRLLLAAGANVEAIGESGTTALSKAANCGNEMIVRLLLAEGANIDAVDDGGMTALMLAVFRDNETIVRLLLAKGCNIEAVGYSGQTALILAAHRGHEKIVQLLLDKGTNVDAEDIDGDTALILAAHWGHETIVQKLLAEGAKLEAANRAGTTALIKATIYGQKTIVQLLLAKGANIEATDAAGKTALFKAVSIGRWAMVQLLLAKGANIEATDEAGSTVLIEAASHGRETIVQLLLAKGANVEAVDRDGRTALIWAANCGYKTIVQLLLAKGANIEAVDEGGMTALMRAAFYNNETIVELLLAEGANIEAVAMNGKSALDCATPMLT